MHGGNGQEEKSGSMQMCICIHVHVVLERSYCNFLNPVLHYCNSFTLQFYITVTVM